ncbi:MAG: hypothetical protein FJX90_07510 [Bacteroidetes bacterium]|nr:hypothetical protein [Bacteroidota bacterium]
MTPSVFEKYDVNSKDELLEVLEDLIFEERKKWKDRLHIRPLRIKQVARMQELSNDYVAVCGSSQFEFSEFIPAMQHIGLAEMRQYEKVIATLLTQVFQTHLPDAVTYYAYALHVFLTGFEDFLLQHLSAQWECASEVNSREYLDSAACIQYWLEGKEDEAYKLLGKEMKRLRTILK